MKLSEQYIKKLTKLNEQPNGLSKEPTYNSAEPVGTDKFVKPVKDMTALEKAGMYGIAGTAIAGTFYLAQKPAGKAAIRLFTHGTLSPYGWFKRFQNTRKVNKAIDPDRTGLTDNQLKLMYENLRKVILQRSRVSIDKRIQLVKDGVESAEEALEKLKKYPLTHLEPEAEVDLLKYLKNKYNTKTNIIAPDTHAIIHPLKGKGGRSFEFKNISQTDWDALPVATQDALKQKVGAGIIKTNDVTAGMAEELAMSKAERDAAAAAKDVADKLAKQKDIDARAAKLTKKSGITF